MNLHRSAYVALLSAALMAGCKSTHFELELRPNGDELHRKVTMWSEDGEGEKKQLVEFRLEDLQRMAEIYATDVPEELVAKHVFEASFAGKMPDDLGGAGWYLHGKTSLGSLFAYAERFGEDEIADDLRAREMAANVAFDLLLAWLESEFGDEPDFADFREFVDKTAREDFWNLVLYMWGYDTFAAAALPQGQRVDEDALMTDLGVRVIIYLADRDYFDPLQIPQIVRQGAQADASEEYGPFLEMLCRGIASKMGIPDDAPLPAPLAALVADSDRVLESLEAFDTESVIAKSAADNWNKSGYVDEEIEFGSDSVIGELLDQALLSDFGFLGIYRGGNHLTATLRIPVEPIATNGIWDAELGVSWTGMTGGARFGQNLPNILYATWSEPNEVFQNEHFGRLLLDGAELADYWSWHTGLEDGQANQWDNFLTALEPAPELADDLQHFCFAGEEAKCAEAQDSDRSPYYIVNHLIWELGREQE